MSHIASAKTKQEFTIGLIRGLGGYLPLTQRLEYARKVYQLCGERPIDGNRPLDAPRAMLPLEDESFPKGCVC